MVSILAAVNSDYAFLADVANQERFREYDYGPGLGTGLEVALDRSQNRLLGLYYRLHWINVSNGSIYNKPDEDGSGEGSDATTTSRPWAAASSFRSTSGSAWAPTPWSCCARATTARPSSRTRTSATRRRASTWPGISAAEGGPARELAKETALQPWAALAWAW